MSKQFDLNSYKKSINISDDNLKPEKYIVVDDFLQEVIGIPGLPMGHITQIYGKSDTGKTSLLYYLAAKAQEQGILPAIIVTERKVNWDRAELMGFDPSNCIIEENAEFLEDVFSFMNRIINDVTKGVLPYDVCLFWDSVGNTCSKDEIKETKDGNTEMAPAMMKAARVISNNVRPLSQKLGNTRKKDCPHYVGACIINNVYNAPPAFPGGATSLKPYGGGQLTYRSTLILKTSKKSKLNAVKAGNTLNFGLVSKISVDKNHISNTANSGEIVVVADRIFKNDPKLIKAYKDEHKDSWGNVTIFDPENGEVFDGEE